MPRGHTYTHRHTHTHRDRYRTRKVSGQVQGSILSLCFKFQLIKNLHPVIALTSHDFYFPCLRPCLFWVLIFFSAWCWDHYKIYALGNFFAYIPVWIIELLLGKVNKFILWNVFVYFFWYFILAFMLLLHMIKEWLRKHDDGEIESSDHVLLWTTNVEACH